MSHYMLRSALLLAVTLLAALPPNSGATPPETFAAEPAASRAMPTALDPGQLALVARVLDLDDHQQELVARLLALDAAERRRLEFLLSLQGLAIVTADGRVLEPRPGEDAVRPHDFSGGITPVLLTLDDVFDLINTVQTKINTISTTVGTLLGRLPDGSAFRTFTNQIDLDKLQGILDILRDELEAVIAIAQEIREGFQQFDAADFRAKLHKVLTDVGTAWVDVQRLECIERPDRPIRTLKLTLLGNLVDKAPAIALYGLSRVLDVTGEDWPNVVSEVMAAVPQELIDPGFCGPELEAPAAAVCAVLRKEDVRRKIKRTAAGAKALSFATRLAKTWTTEDKVVCAGATVVAGAQAGTNVKNPLNGILSTVDKLLDRIGKMAEKLQKIVEKCGNEDLEMERQLRTCTAPRGVFLAGRARPTFQEVADLVGYWTDQAEGALDVSRVAHVRADLDAADRGAGTPVGYAMLCDAYDTLIFASTKDQRALQKELHKTKGGRK